jgi:hypothetical protein
LNCAVYACFGIFFIACLPKVTLILRYLWKTKFQGKLRLRQKWPSLIGGYDDGELNIPLSVQAGETYFYRFNTWVSKSKGIPRQVLLLPSRFIGSYRRWHTVKVLQK